MEQGKKYIVRWQFVLLLMFISIFIFCNGDYAYADVQKASTLSGTLGVNDGFQWTYDAATKTMTVTGEDYAFDYYEIKEIIDESENKIENIVLKECKFTGERFYFMFEGCDTLKGVQFINCNTSSINDMSSMFVGCTSLKSVDISGIDTSNVTDMSYMFSGCSSLTNLTLTDLDTSKVEDMSYMFYYCTALTELILNDLDTSKVEDMSDMFSYCSKLENLEINNFNTSNVKDMSYMFFDCSNLKKLNLNNFNTSNVTDMQSMFSGCSRLNSLYINNFDTSKVKYMRSMFYNCSNLLCIDLSGFNTQNVVAMEKMFTYCSSIEWLDINHFDTSNVKDMSFMFADCLNLKSLDVSKFNTSNVEDLSDMFAGCSKLDNLDISHFDTSNVKDMAAMFAKCSNLNNLDVSHFDTSNVTSMAAMFSECSNLKSLDATSFDTSKVMYIEGMFWGCQNLTYLDLSTWDMSTIYYEKRYDESEYFGFISKCDNIQTIITPKAFPDNIFIALPDAFCDNTGAIITNLSKESCNKMLTRMVPFSVTYFLNGGHNHNDNPNTYKVISDTITLKTPTRVGYDFAGWYSDKACTKKVTQIIKGSTGDKTFYAKWTAHKYNIKFNGNGATNGKMSTLKNKKYDTNFNLTANAFKKKGYTFTGWNTQKDGKGASFANKASVKNLTSENGKTVTLYAQWQKTKYKISYKLNGGKNNKSNKSAYYVTTKTFKLKNPTRKGYTFKGWYSDKKCTKKVTKITKGTTGNKTYYAKWVKTKYKITYVLNKGKNSKSNKKTYYITTKTFKLKNPTRKGYVFKGWYSDKKCTKKVTKIKKGSTGNVKLYAKWVKK